MSEPISPGDLVVVSGELGTLMLVIAVFERDEPVARLVDPSPVTKQPTADYLLTDVRKVP